MKQTYVPSPADIRFLVIGAEKSGTTWLADMLRQHPNIFIPAQKELHYFNRQMDEAPELENYNFGKPANWYLSLFQGAAEGQILGECCPAYLWDEQAPQKIRDFNPSIKILMILRNPVERFLSSYRYTIQRGLVGPANMQTVLRKYKALLLDRGAYHRQVKRYLDLFPRDQVEVFWFDDLRKDSRQLLLDVEMFIGVPAFVPENISVESNITGEPRFPLISRAMASARRFTRRHHLTWLIESARALGLARLFTSLRERNKSGARASRTADLEDFDRTWLVNYYVEDVSNLEKLLNVDLSDWKRK